MISCQPIGGEPASGGWDQFAGPGGQTRLVGATPFQDSKGQGQATSWFEGNLRSPDKIAPFADPTVVPNDFWRSVVGRYLSTLGWTPERSYRPDWMARDWNNVGTEVKTQLFAGPGGQTQSGISDMNDAATLGANSVIPVERSGLGDTAGSVFALKWLLDQAGRHVGPLLAPVGGRAAASWLESPGFRNAVSGNTTPLVDSLYGNVPAATQNILQYQNNPPATYDPLGYSVTANQNPQQ